MDVVLNTDQPPHYGFHLHYLQSIILSLINCTVHRAMVSYNIVVVVVVVVGLVVVVVCWCI
jgi:hypothetical protein